MRGELDFQNYSQLLGQGLFADNVILSLLDYKELGKLDAQERKALIRAKSFLDDAIAGGNLIKRKLGSAHDVKAAKAYSSIQSIRFRNQQSQDLINYIRELRDTIEMIIGGNAVDPQKLKQLDNFFSHYSQTYFQKTRAVLEAV